MTKIFISYRRIGGANLARNIYDALLRQGYEDYEVYFDVRDATTGDIEEILLKKIESSKDFLVILTPNSLDRCHDEKDWFTQEIAHAIKHKKNILPILAPDFHWPTSRLPETIQSLHKHKGLTFTHEFFEEFFKKLTGLLHSHPGSRKGKFLKYGIYSLLILFVIFILSVLNFQIFHSPTSMPKQEDRVVEPTRPTTQDPSSIPTNWYVYRDVGSKENHGEWANFMPENGSQMMNLFLADRTNPAFGATSVRVDVNFLEPWWCGLAVSPHPEKWGDLGTDPAFNLSHAKKLVFWARGNKGGEMIQVKVSTTGDKPFGDSAPFPAKTPWISLTPTWTPYELPLKGFDLSRVMTPFVFVVDKAHNGSEPFSFFLDEVYFEMRAEP